MNYQLIASYIDRFKLGEQWPKAGSYTFGFLIYP